MSFEDYNKSIFDDDESMDFSDSLLANLEDSGAEDNFDFEAEIPTDPTTFYAPYENPMNDTAFQSRSSFDEEPIEIYRSSDFIDVAEMYFDKHDRETTKYLAYLNEEDQSTLLKSLTSKLYDIIVQKIDHIDYGDIPKSKGDITKVTNFDMTCECIDLIRQIVEEFHEDTSTVDIINTAINNMTARTPMFRAGFMKKNGFIMNLYCNTVLAIIGATSYMSSTCIEFIKSPGQDTFKMSIDRVAYLKTKEALLLTTLKNFNNGCKNGDFDKACDSIMNRKFSEGAVATAFTVAAVVIVFAIPLLRSIVYYFFFFRTRVSDYFYIQANILEAHALRLQISDDSDVRNKDKVVERQLRIVEKFRKISNAFAIKDKKAEVESYKQISDEDKQMEAVKDSSGSPSVLF